MAPKSKPISEEEPQLDDPNVASSSSDTAPPPDTSYAPTYGETLDFIWRNAEILCQMFTDELEEQAFSQALFAEKILSCSADKLSDVLRNPKSWAKLRTGRDIQCAIYLWMCTPSVQRAFYYQISEEELKKLTKSKYNESSCSKPAQNLRENCSKIWEIRTEKLQWYYNREKRPNDACLEFLAGLVKLDLSIVTKFFKDAQREEGIEKEVDTEKVDTDGEDTNEGDTDDEEEEGENSAAPQQSKGKWKPKKKKKNNNKKKKKNGKYGRY